MAPIALAFGVLDLTGSVSDLGFVMAAGGVPFVAFVLVGGVWADRISRLRVMALSGMVATASQVATALVFLTGSAACGSRWCWRRCRAQRAPSATRRWGR